MCKLARQLNAAPVIVVACGGHREIVCAAELQITPRPLGVVHHIGCGSVYVTLCVVYLCRE